MVDFLDGVATVIVGMEHKLDTSVFVDNVVLTSVLVSKGVSTNNNRLHPTRHKSGNVGDNDGLSEHSAVEDISNGSVRRPPHLLEVEFLDTLLVGSDGSALDTDSGFLDGLSSVDGDLVASFVTLLDTQIVVLEILELNIRLDVLQKLVN